MHRAELVAPSFVFSCLFRGGTNRWHKQVWGQMRFDGERRRVSMTRLGPGSDQRLAASYTHS